VKVLICGGQGFLGRAVVKALANQNTDIVIGGRFKRNTPPASNISFCAMRFEKLMTQADWMPLLTGIDVVVNLVGILRERGRETYEKIYVRAPIALAQACAQLNIKLIHVTALGLRADAQSRFNTCKLQSEIALKSIASSHGLNLHLVRPSLLDGPDGFGAKWLRRIANWPVLVFPASAVGLIAPLPINDFGKAMAALCLDSTGCQPVEIEMGGAATMTMRDYLLTLRRSNKKPPLIEIAVPGFLGRVVSHALDVLHLTPYSFGHHELMLRDNYPRINRVAGLVASTNK
jgi:uncharacterized protein YbjT (DUF2867 family)